MSISEKQSRYLRSALQALRRRDFDEVLHRIYRIVVDATEDGEELDEQWRHLWDKVRDYALDEMPDEIYRRVDKAIEDIKRVDEKLWQVRLSEEQPVTILLGAGASKPSPSNIPVVTEFLPELWRRARKLDREDLNKLASWCDNSNISNIEDLLTAAQIANFSAKSGGILSLLHYFLYSRGEPPRTYRTIEGKVVPRPVSRPESGDVAAIALLQDTLQILFSLLTEPMLLAQPNDGHKAIAELISKHNNTTIITTNYDGCIDQAIQELGIPCDYLIEPQGLSKVTNAAKIIKIHGSINWSYCESCQEMRRYDLSFIKEMYDKESLSYPVMGICKNCGGLSRPMIVPPLLLKFLMFPPLAGLWDRAQIAFQEAKIILVVGYSFSEADPYITKMISRAMGGDRDKQLIIVDTNPSLAGNVTEKLVAHIDNFDRKRVIRAVESCDVLMPQVCKSFLGEEIAAKNRKLETTPKRRKRIS